jgi:transcriptional regulator GlxA family with amidase domain
MGNSEGPEAGSCRIRLVKRRLLVPVVLGFALPILLAAGSRVWAAPAEPPLRTVGFLIVPGVYNSELMAPYDVLDHVRFRTKDAPRLFTVAPKAGPLRTFEGLTLTPHYSFADAPPIDLLVVPSAEHNMDRDLENAALIAWVRERGRKAKLVLSLCDGAFVLAKAGLLDGLEATTFPGDQDRFAAMFPTVKLQRGVIFVHDGKAVTSVGGARSYDPAMYLVERLYGDDARARIGEGLVLDWSRVAVKHRVAPGARLP